MSVLHFPTRAEQQQEQLTADQEWEKIEQLNKEVQDLLHQISRWGRKEQRAQNFLRYRFNVSHHTELTIGQMKKAIPLLRETVARCEAFSERMHAISDAFDTEVIGRGAPWTPWIGRRLGRRRMRDAGPNPNWAELLKELEGEMADLR